MLNMKKQLYSPNNSKNDSNDNSKKIISNNEISLTKEKSNLIENIPMYYL